MMGGRLFRRAVLQRQALARKHCEEQIFAFIGQHSESNEDYLSIWEALGGLVGRFTVSVASLMSVLSSFVLLE